MIGRCDNGHLHPASSEEFASLRALDAVTPSDDIIKVPARYFFVQEVIQQEIAKCTMLTRVRFECPAKLVGKDERCNNLVDKRFASLEEKILKLEKNTRSSVPGADEKGDAALEKRIESLESNVQQISIIIANLCATVMNLVQGNTSAVDAVKKQLTELEETSRLQTNAIEQTVRDLELKVDVFRAEDSAVVLKLISDTRDDFEKYLIRDVNEIKEDLETKLTDPNGILLDHVRKFVRKEDEKIEAKLSTLDNFVATIDKICEESEKSTGKLEEKICHIEKTDGRSDDLCNRIVNLGICENDIEKKEIGNGTVNGVVIKEHIRQLDERIKIFELNFPIKRKSLGYYSWLCNNIASLEHRIFRIETVLLSKPLFCNDANKLKKKHLIGGLDFWNALNFRPYASVMERPYMNNV